MGMIGNSLAQGLVSGANIEDGTVDTVDIRALAVTPAKLSAGAPFWDAVGNVGIGGATPNAWNSAWKGIQFSPTAALTNRTNKNLYLSNNWYIDSGSVDRYIQDGYATFYTQNSGGQHAWYIAASGTAGNAISFAQAMLLDAIGQVGVGITPSNAMLHIKGDWVSGHSTVKAQTSTAIASGGVAGYGVYDSDGSRSAYVSVDTTAFNVWGQGNKPMYLATNNVKRAQLSSGGRFEFATDGTMTTLPLTHFHVRADWISGYGAMGVQTTTAGAATGISFFNSSGTRQGYINVATDTGIMSLGNNNAAALIFETANLERARFDSNGYLIIGSAGSSVGSPVGKLQVWETSATVGIDIRSGQASGGAGYRGHTTTLIEGSGANTGSSGNVAIKFHHNDYNNLSGNLSFWTKNDSNTLLQRLTVYYDGTVQFNAYGSGTLASNASGVISASDGRYKTKTHGLTNAIAIVRQLAELATYYRWNEGTPWHSEHEEIGWVAQDVAAVLPEASPEPEEEGRFKNYHDRAILAYMAKAIDDQQAIIEQMQTRLAALEA